jgi:putative chitinase
MIDRKATQTRLGVTPDGIWGIGTYSALLRVVAPAADPAVIRSLANACIVHFPAYGVDKTVTRLADVVAQTANETGGYTRFEEDLRYRASTMLKQWPRHFTAATAAAAVGNPREIAEIAYGVKSATGKGRMGNVKPGDGYAFRGRGMLQLTGRSNYEAADKRLGIGLDTNPELAAVPALSLLIACDFYRENNVFAALDRGDTDRAREITNGGRIGLAHVNAYRAKLLEVLR